MEFIKIKNQIIKIEEIAHISLLKIWAQIVVLLKCGEKLNIYYRDFTHADPTQEEKEKAEKEFNIVWDLLQEREA